MLGSQLTLCSQTDSQLTLGSQKASDKVSCIVLLEFCIGFGQILIFVENRSDLKGVFSQNGKSEPEGK